MGLLPNNFWGGLHCLGRDCLCLLPFPNCQYLPPELQPYPLS